MAKENFSDNSYLLLKGLQNAKISRDYFENLKLTSHTEMKRVLNGWINRIDFIVNDVKLRLGDESRAIFDAEIDKGDNILFDSIRDAMINLTPEQNETIEKLVLAMAKGEEILITE